MKKKQFLLLIIVMIIGLFSIAYAETVASITAAENNAADHESADAESSDSVNPVVVAPKPPVVIPAPPVAPPPLPREGETISWWDGGNEAIPFGKTITLVDVWTGKSFEAIRTYGHNHADMETASSADTAIMKEIWGGSWNWDRRPVVAIVDGQNIAVSCAGMPHAGLEGPAAETTVKNRSAGYGTGLNLDKVKGNSMDGHFDLHLLNSKTHGTQRVDSRHQAMIREAAGL